MANVRFNASSFYVPKDKFLVAINESCTAHKEDNPQSKVTAHLAKDQVFAVTSETPQHFKTKVGWIAKEACHVLDQSSNEVVQPLPESFVVKVISNTAVYTEPATTSHATTVLRIGSLPRVVGESHEFYQLKHGGFIQKNGCRHY